MRAATTARWPLSNGIPLPLALRVGEQLHRAALSCAARVYGRDAIPWVLSGHGVPPGTAHRHAFYLAEDAGGDGWIDHVVVHAAAGLDERALAALASMTHVVAAELGEMQVGGGDAARRGGALPDGARRWVSMTPYLPPRHRNKGAQWHDQLRLECVWRGLPAPRRIADLPGVETVSGLLPPTAFVRHRAAGFAGADAPRPPPYLPGWCLAVEFERPVAGPLALGYACHFGLGVFRPATAP